VCPSAILSECFPISIFLLRLTPCALPPCQTHLCPPQTFFKGAIDGAPESALAWAALAALYTAQARDRDAKRALKQAASFSADPDSLRLELAESAVGWCAEPFVDKCLALHKAFLADRHGSSGGGDGGSAADSTRLRICQARARAAAHHYDEAIPVFKQLALELPDRADILTELGHAYFCAGRPDEALKSYTAALARAADTRDATLLLRTAQLTCAAAESTPPGSVQHAMWARARDSALRACKFAPSATTWLTVGTACAALNSMSEAEEALSEACVLNNRNAHVWALLALLTLRLERRDEAEQVRALPPAHAAGWPCGDGRRCSRAFSLASARVVPRRPVPAAHPRPPGSHASLPPAIAHSPAPLAPAVPALQALAQALRLGLSDAVLLQRLGSAWLAIGDWERAEDTLRRSVAAGAGPKAERLLADAISERGMTIDAIELYTKVLADAPLESEARHIKARLQTLHEIAGLQAA
jgi:tetratricopeptide (TPR) repeat protein